MQVTSAEYREEQKRDLRNESYVWVYLGIVSKEAQANAYISSELTPYSSQGIFQETKFEAYYASLEDSFTRVDDTFYFLPDNLSYALFQGAVSQDLNQAITIDFIEYHDLSIKGLTIDFGEYYPTEFSVSNGNQTYNYTKDSPGIFTMEDVLSDTDYITITPITMIGGNQRLRIHSITFGVGLTFDNSTLINTQRRNTVDHLSNGLPVKTFSFTIDNLSKKFNKDNPNSFINFLEEGQTVTYEYGRKLDDDSIYRIPGGTVALKTWSSNDIQAKFTCTGNLDLMTASYQYGLYRPDGISAYELAQDVFASFGNFHNYRIDSYLRNVIIRNPLPVTSCKNALQMIANASRSVLYEDRDGQIVIESSFMPEIVSVVYNNATGYSDEESLIDETIETYDYATTENAFSKVDGTLRILPPQDQWSSGNLLANGYVSSHTGDKGLGQWNCSITIEWEAQWTFYGLELEYPEWCIPTRATVIGYANGAEVVRETTDEPTSFSTLFVECDKITVLFERVKENYQRIHCHSIRVGDVSDYNLTYHELADTPTATSIEKVKNIETHYYNYSYSDPDAEEIKKYDASVGENVVTFVGSNTYYYDFQIVYTSSSTGTISIISETPTTVAFTASEAGEVQILAKKYVNVSKVKTNVGWNEVTFGSPYYDYILHFTNREPGMVAPTVLISRSYYLLFSTSYEGYEVQISAKKIDVADSTLNVAVGETGSTKISRNTLIDNAEQAQLLGEWIGEYYASDTEYTLVSRGEPALDCDDLIYLENKFVDKNLIRITDETLDTGTGMSTRAQKLTARRVSYVER